MGRCTACQADIARATRRYESTGDPRVDGRMREIDGWKAGTVEAYLIMMDGRLMRLHLCGRCDPMTPSVVMAAWRNVLAEGRNALDDQFRVAMGGSAMTDEQRTRSRAGLAKLVAAPPLGTLCAHPVEATHGRT